MKKSISKEVIEGTCLGVPIDIEIQQKVEGDTLTLTLSTMAPAMRLDDGVLKVWAPPRYPWPEGK